MMFQFSWKIVRKISSGGGFITLTQSNSLLTRPSLLELYTDASLTGWGQHLNTEKREVTGLKTNRVTLITCNLWLFSWVFNPCVIIVSMRTLNFVLIILLQLLV